MNDRREQRLIRRVLTGQPRDFAPHDFRRMFITDAIRSGLPPHIAQAIAGHTDINTTMGYHAIYPTESTRTPASPFASTPQPSKSRQRTSTASITFGWSSSPSRNAEQPDMIGRTSPSW
ncbi:site-specific integrase [Streptomyces sp. NPDC055036]